MGPTVISKGVDDPATLALKDHYRMILRSMTTTEMIIRCHSKLPDAQDRADFNRAKEGLTLPGLIELCTLVLVSKHTVEKPTHEIKSNPRRRKGDRDSFGVPDGIRAIAMPEVLASDKGKKTLDLSKEAMLPQRERCYDLSGLIDDEDEIPTKTDNRPFADRDIAEGIDLASVPLAVPVSEIVVIRCLEPIAGLLLGETYQATTDPYHSDHFVIGGRSFFKSRFEVIPQQRRSMMPTILPSPMPNMVEVEKIEDSPIPREEKQFAIRTDRPRRTPADRPSITVEEDPWKMPARGSDHSPRHDPDFEPDSGRYSVIPCARSEKKR